MNKKDFIFVSISNLPDRCASGLRISSFVEALISHGRSCYVIGQAAFPPLENRTISPGYSLYSIFDTSVKSSVKEKIIAFVFPKRRIFRILRSIIKENPNIYGLFIYQKIPGFSTPAIIRFCRKHQIRLFFDIVEYQIASQQNLLGFFINYLPSWMTINYYCKKGKVTSISRYLCDFFASKNIDTAYFPFFFDTSKISFIPNNTYNKDDSKLFLLYAGVPQGGRDTIVNAIKGLLLLSTDERKLVHFELAGATEKGMIDLGLTQDELCESKEFCKILGRVPHERVMELYSKADFSLLLKPAKKRFSKAGFPTKISESLAVGVPPICNDTGDIGYFVKDSINGLILKDDSPLCFAEGVRRALLLSKEQNLKLRKNARETADNELSLKRFSLKLELFVSDGDNN